MPSTEAIVQGIIVYGDGDHSHGLTALATKVFTRVQGELAACDVLTEGRGDGHAQ